MCRLGAPSGARQDSSAGGGGWHNGLVRKSSTQPEASTSEISEDELIVRILADRKAGKDTTKDVELLLRLAGTNNRAALDRLAQ